MLKYLMRYPRQFEAVGILIVLLAAYFQFEAEGLRRSYVEYRFDWLDAEIEFARQKTSELFACSSDSSCGGYEYDFVMAEAPVFRPTLFFDPEPRWRTIRKVFFFFGTALIVLSKLIDLPKRAPAPRHPFPWE
ncbi:hypothetical protein [Nitratireductor sp. XY-223]|uniref:hypothetical protein n=1 Tax=Nitratireductor sp. XY-223 TaxID=2561926 RepID=UPI0010A9A7A3|nr:hypothetical protein [Nitratireductor sp. XY-223]